MHVDQGAGPHPRGDDPFLAVRAAVKHFGARKALGGSRLLKSMSSVIGIAG